jgi:splicing factor U2AF 65 kDa subunit
MMPGMMPGMMMSGVNPMMPNMPVPPPPSQQTRPFRRLYVGGLPNPCLDYQLQSFLCNTLIALGLVRNTGRPPIISTIVSQDRGFAFVEFTEVSDCTACMQLDQITFNGMTLKIKRPRDTVLPYGASSLAEALFVYWCMAIFVCTFF